MENLLFFPFGNKYVTVEFDCSKCGTLVESKIKVPLLVSNIEEESDSLSKNVDFAVCENCKKDFDINVFADSVFGYVEVNDVDLKSVKVHEIEYNIKEYYNEQIDAILNSAYYDFYFLDEIENLKALNNLELKSKELQETLRRQIYSSAITCLEDYLSTILIQHVLNKEKYFKRFVKTFKNIQNRKFTLNEIYDKLDSIKDIVKEELIDVLYHDLPKVKNIYYNTLGIDFPDIGDLMSIIKTRHDMVHRNGKNKEGVKINLTKNLVLDVIDKVNLFIQDIDAKITEADI